MATTYKKLTDTDEYKALTAADENIEAIANAAQTTANQAKSAASDAYDKAAANTTSIENLTETLGAAVYTGTLGDRTVTFYNGGAVVNLGEMDSRTTVSAWLVKGGVWNNVNVRLVLCTIGTTKVAVQIINSYDAAQGKCTQIMLEGQSTFVRRLMSGSIPAWELTNLHNITSSWNAATHTASFALQDYHGATCRTSTLTIPEATTTAAGLMPASAVSKLADLETRLAQLESAAS